VNYPNGQIPESALVPISGRAGAHLLAGPAASWERGCAEVHRRYGWRPAPSGPGDAYRVLALQITTFLDRYAPAKTGGGHWGDVRWWNGVRYVRLRYRRSDGQLAAAAAVPGTSNHGKARAVDVRDLGGFAGRRYAQFGSVFIPLGWSNAEGRSVNEPWHWVDLLSPELVSSGHANWGAAPTAERPVLPPSPITPKPEEDENPMDQIIAIYLRRTGKLPTPAAAAEYIGAVAAGETTWKQVDQNLQGEQVFRDFAALGSRSARDAVINQNAPKGWVA
jgi:hypothetical protein